MRCNLSAKLLPGGLEAMHWGPAKVSISIFNAQVHQAVGCICKQKRPSIYCLCGSHKYKIQPAT